MEKLIFNPCDNYTTRDVKTPQISATNSVKTLVPTKVSPDAEVLGW